MMLRGTKPLTVFSDGYGFFPASVTRYLRLFERRVEAGEFSKREFVLLSNAYPSVKGIHYLMYSLPGEEWRFDVMIELKLSLNWTHDHEREEGRLLGYSASECDPYMERLQAQT